MKQETDDIYTTHMQYLSFLVLFKKKKKLILLADSTAMMTTDDFLPILIFLIIKSEIPNW